MAAVALVELECKRLGFEPENGTDLHFNRLARDQGNTLVGLESVDFGLSLLTSFSSEENEVLVKTTLEEMKLIRQEFADIVNAWKSGDVVALEKLLNSMATDAPVLFKRLVTDRSESWLPKIEQLSRGSKNAIVIVGAAHMVGKRGLVELLRGKGFKVAQE
jgi:uncharacterized protein YbaP (TraB family)